MRIAQITLNVYDNYGNMLQKYALNRALKKFAESVDVLWQHSTTVYLPDALELNQPIKKTMLDVAFRIVWQTKIKEFNDANISTRFDIPYLEDLADEYDYFVIGSDQVWNPKFNVPGRFLDFAPPEKRIAYAASIAIPELPDDVKETYRQKISEMPHVSVRENDGCDLVEKLTGKRPIQVLDPVFLLTADEWREIAKRPRWLDDKKYERGYVLTYFFGGNVPKAVKNFAAEVGLPTVNLRSVMNFEHYTSGIEEFVYLVEHANFICTHSFHGTSFAMIFKRPFITYKVARTVIEKFSRLESLLELFGLSERATDLDLKIKVADPFEIDFSRRDEVLPRERAKAFKFLSKALGTEPREEISEVTHDED